MRAEVAEPIVLWGIEKMPVLLRRILGLFVLRLLIVHRGCPGDKQLKKAMFITRVNTNKAGSSPGLEKPQKGAGVPPRFVRYHPLMIYACTPTNQPTHLRAEAAEATVVRKRQDAVVLVVVVTPLVAPLVRGVRGCGGPVELVGGDCEGSSALVFVARALSVAQAGAVPVQVPFVTAPAL